MCVHGAYQGSVYNPKYGQPKDRVVEHNLRGKILGPTESVHIV